MGDLVFLMLSWILFFDAARDRCWIDDVRKTTCSHSHVDLIPPHSLYLRLLFESLSLGFFGINCTSVSYSTEKKEPNVENISVFPLFSVCCRAAWVSFSKKFYLLFSSLPSPLSLSAIVVINFNSLLFLFLQNTFCSSHTTPANAARPGRDDDGDDTAPLLVGQEFSSLHIVSRSEASWDTETSNDSGEEWSKRKEMFSWKMVLIILFISLFNISHDRASRATLWRDSLNKDCAPVLGFSRMNVNS